MQGRLHCEANQLIAMGFEALWNMFNDRVLVWIPLQQPWIEQHVLVVCRWKGIQNPKKQDWIALYMDDADPFQKAPVRYFEAGASPTHADYGYGSLK